MTDLYSVLKEKLNTVDVDGTTLYIAEGDTLLDQEQLKTFANLRELQDKLRAAQKEAEKAGLGYAPAEEPARGLMSLKSDKGIVRWAPQAILTYRVARSSFASEQQYKMVVDNMAEATREWERTCGINFEHRAVLDTKPGVGREGLLFVVRGFDAGGRFIAAAFFPNDPVERRQVLIDPTYFTTSFDKVGVLRHELGHVLGFRHEHIRNDAPAVCPNESLWDAQVLTKYDPTSVMHYFCGGVGTHDLKISALDVAGARAVYGPPLGVTALVDAEG